MQKRNSGEPSGSNSRSSRITKKVKIDPRDVAYKTTRELGYKDAQDSNSEEERDFEQQVEWNLEKSKRKRKHKIRVDGYDSEEASSGSEDAGEVDEEAPSTRRPNMREWIDDVEAGDVVMQEEGNRQDAQEKDDDLFAEEEHVGKNAGDDELVPKRKRDQHPDTAVHMTGSTIEGQEENPGEENQFTTVLLDEDDQEKAKRRAKEIKIIPFNMRDEMEEGEFDEEGAYAEKKDIDRQHDNWLQDVSAKDIRKAAEAHAKREQQIKAARELEMAASRSTKKSDLLRELVEFLQPRENVIRAMKRLGGGIKQKRTWKTKQQAKKQVSDPSADSSPSTAKEAENKKAIERITEIASLLLSQGFNDIYEEIREEMLQELEETG